MDAKEAGFAISLQSQEAAHQLRLPRKDYSLDETCPRVGGKRSKRYAKIDDEFRKIIIFEVIHLGSSVRAVSEKLGINVSSAKNVISIYKKEGRIEKKKNRFKLLEKEHSAFDPTGAT